MDDFARAFVSFFAIIDPVGNVLVFQIFTRRLSARERLTVAAVANGAAWVLMAVFWLGGSHVLEFMGISEAGFRVAAGLLLLPPAYRLVMEGQPFGADVTETMRPLDLALVPLATPLIAGPGSLAATISFTETLGRDTTLAAFTLVMLVSFAGFLAAGLIFRLAGEPLIRLLARMVGLVLFAIAVDFVLDGSKTFFDV